MNFWEKQKYRNRNQISDCHGLAVRTGTDSKDFLCEELLGMMELFYILIIVVVFISLISMFNPVINCSVILHGKKKNVFGEEWSQVKTRKRVCSVLW